MSSSTTTTTEATSVEESGLSNTEWIVIVVVLVIILVVLIIAIAKCLDIGKSSPAKSLIQNDAQSMRSETARSTTTRSVASTRSRPKSTANMRKLPLNAEITRFSAGRVSRSAEYGVVIKDIKKTVQEQEPGSARLSSPPGYTENVDTLNTYKDSTLQHQPQTLSSPPSANLIVNQQYATHGLAPANTKAVFVASDDIYSTPYSNASPRTLPTQTQQQPNHVMVDMRYPILAPASVIMQ